MRIYEDVTYHPQDMIEIPGGFQVQRYCIRTERPEIGSEAWIKSFGPEQAARYISALRRPCTPDSDPEMEALLVDSKPRNDPPIPQPAPYSHSAQKRPWTPGAAKIAEEAARIAEEAAYEPTVNLEAAAEDLMPKLLDDHPLRNLSPDPQVQR